MRGYQDHRAAYDQNLTPCVVSKDLSFIRCAGSQTLFRSLPTESLDRIRQSIMSKTDRVYCHFSVMEKAASNLGKPWFSLLATSYVLSVKIEDRGHYEENKNGPTSRTE